MKKCGSTASSSKDMDGLGDTTNTLLSETTSSVVKENATNGCQHFSMRQYVADIRKRDPKACNPFGEKNYQKWEQLKTPLDVPQFKWWRCKNCVRVATSTPVLPEVQETSQEKESAKEGVGTRTLQLPEKRPGKRSRATGESAFPFKRKKKGTSKRFGTGANPVVQKMYENLEARYTSEPFPPSSVDCITNKNPADFSVPGPKNKYMIGGKDLMPRKNSGKRRRYTSSF